MEEAVSNIGRRLLRTMLEKHYSPFTIDNVVGAVGFSKNPTEVKMELLSFIEQTPIPTEEEVFRKAIEISRKNVEG